MKPSEKLVEKLRSLGYRVGDDWKFERLRPGHYGRSAGGWSWMIYSTDGGQIGSPDNVSQCLKSKTLVESERDDGTIYAE